MVISVLGYFVLYSFVGWIGDTAYRSIDAGKFKSVTFLPVPLCPIYGFSALLVLMLHSSMSSLSWMWQFLVFAVIAACVEGITAFVLFRFLRKRLWHYKNTFLNIGGYTDILHAFIWGVSGLVLVRFHPFIERMLSL